MPAPGSTSFQMMVFRCFKEPLYFSLFSPFSGALLTIRAASPLTWRSGVLCLSGLAPSGWSSWPAQCSSVLSVAVSGAALIPAPCTCDYVITWTSVTPFPPSTHQSGQVILSDHCKNLFHFSPILLSLSQFRNLALYLKCCFSWGCSHHQHYSSQTCTHTPSPSHVSDLQLSG